MMMALFRVADANWLSWNSSRAGNSETKSGLELPILNSGNQKCQMNVGRVAEVYVPVENTSLQSI